MPSLPADTTSCAVPEREGERAARPVVEILGVELFEVRRREVVEHLERLRRQSQQRLPPQSLRRIPHAVGGLHEEVNRVPMPGRRGSTRRWACAVLVKKREIGCAGLFRSIAIMCAATGGGAAPRPRPRPARRLGRAVAARPSRAASAPGQHRLLAACRRRESVRRRRRRSRHRTVAAPAADGRVEDAVDEIQAPVPRERRHELRRRDQLRLARGEIDAVQAAVGRQHVDVFLALSITGVAVDVLVQIQFAALRGSTVLSNVRRQIVAPVAASSAASVFDADSV